MLGLAGGPPRDRGVARPQLGGLINRAQRPRSCRRGLRSCCLDASMVAGARGNSRSRFAVFSFRILTGFKAIPTAPSETRDRMAASNAERLRTLTVRCQRRQRRRSRRDALRAARACASRSARSAPSLPADGTLGATKGRAQDQGAQARLSPVVPCPCLHTSDTRVRRRRA